MTYSIVSTKSLKRTALKTQRVSLWPTLSPRRSRHCLRRDVCMVGFFLVASNCKHDYAKFAKFAIYDLVHSLEIIYIYIYIYI